MNARRTITIAAAALGVLAAACGTSDDTAADETAPTTTATTGSIAATASTTEPPPTSVRTVATTTPSAGLASTAPIPAATTTDPAGAGDSQTIVRFSAADAHVDVTIAGDDATIRDFLSMLPLTLQFEEFNGREKISYLPRPLDTTDTAGSDPKDGDLIYYAPWGNLGFYYNTAGIGFSDDVIHLGTYNATASELTALEDGDVTVDIAP